MNGEDSGKFELSRRLSDPSEAAKSNFQASDCCMTSSSNCNLDKTLGAGAFGVVWLVVCWTSTFCLIYSENSLTNFRGAA